MQLRKENLWVPQHSLILALAMNSATEFMSYLSKDSFIIEINFDLIWSLCAEEKKMMGKKEMMNFFLIQWKV